MAGLSRFIDIVRLFDENHDEWTIPDMATELGAPVSTLYRNVRELSKAGFLEAARGSSYRLGPAFVEFDRRFQLTDPLIRSGSKFMLSLIDQIPVPCVVTLARLYDYRVMCILAEQSVNIRFQTSYQRGRPMPLLHGATSKAILAWLKPRRLEEVLDRSDNVDTKKMDHDHFLSELEAIRHRGYSVTRGEVDNELVGLAAPIANREYGISASLSIIADGKILDREQERRVLPLLVSTAQIISNYINDDM
jgi:DNA-binding IclR family transcriptional regulator